MVGQHKTSAVIALTPQPSLYGHTAIEINNKRKIKIKKPESACHLVKFDSKFR